MSFQCFVASAFGHRDVDQVYSRVVQPLLRDFSTSARRVDRVEHNDDIDDKIFALLESADFCIADLTHARPSVYYEAGFAAGRSKPVIYIVRADHFRRRADIEDPNGNLRVHFDLQMKNILVWKSADDPNFRRRLKRRLKLITARLPKPSSNSDAGKASDIATFGGLSLNERRGQLARISHSVFTKLGFSSDTGAVLKRGQTGTSLWRTRGRQSVEVSVHAIDRLPRQMTNQLFPPGRFYDRPLRRAHAVIISLTPVRESSVHRLLPNHRIIAPHTYRSPVRRGFSGGASDSTVHIVSDARSPEEARVALIQIAKRVRADLKRSLEIPADLDRGQNDDFKSKRIRASK